MTSISQLSEVKNILKSIIRGITKEINIQLVQKDHIPIIPGWVTLEIKSHKSGTFITNYHLDTEILREFFSKNLFNDEYSKILPILKSWGLYDQESPSHYNNPFITKLGIFVYNYFKIITQHSEKEIIKSLFPLEFNMSLFKDCWNGILPWLSKSPIKFKILYPIFNIEINTINFPVNEKNNLQFKVPSLNERMQLAEELKIYLSGFEGFITSQSRLEWIQRCGGWIEGEINIPFETLEEAFPVLDILYPKFIEEAFALLGHSKCLVQSFIYNDTFHPVPMTIIPNPDGKSIITKGFRVRQYPNWMNQRYLISKGPPINLNKFKQDFLSYYPQLRKNLKPGSVIGLSLSRFNNAIRSRIFNSIILELVIGLETLLTESASDASLQFRLHASWLIGERYEDRVLIENFTKLLYAIRSKIVHEGGKQKAIDKEWNKMGETITLQNFVELAIHLSRAILLKIIIINNTKYDFLSRGLLISEIKKGRLGGGVSIHSVPVFAESYEDFITNLKNFTS